MKLFLCSDLHCDQQAAARVVEQAEHVDVVVAAGDFGSMRRNVEAAIDVLKSIDRPTVIVPGNNESLEELTAACHGWSSCDILHGSGTQILGTDFFGLGGGVPVTPFGEWSYDLTEEQAADLLSGCPAGCVLVSHSPPFGAVDVTSRGERRGSTAVRRAVEEKRPALVVCGHIHECAGQSEDIDGTPVVNAGPGGVVWDL